MGQNSRQRTAYGWAFSLLRSMGLAEVNGDRFLQIGSEGSNACL